jgi:site-specific recombinase XerD
MFDITPYDAVLVKGTEKTAIQERFQGERAAPILTIGMVKPLFLEWTRYEMRRSPGTLKRYGEAIGWVVRDIGDQPVSGLHLGHLLELRRKMEERGCGAARIGAILNSLRCLLKFCRTVLRAEALDPRYVRIPRLPKRDVVFLSKEEVARLLEGIVGPGDDWRRAGLTRLRLRALSEVLLGTGARISEVLQLRRDDVNFEKREARTIGKGNKERVLFFTERSLLWLGRYLERRQDDIEALFACQGDPPRPLVYESVKAMFKRAGRRAGISKRVTAHILRHTMATTLLFNGCPIGHIKELLGHERLDTTCRYYLGLDKRAAKEAHEKFLSYEESRSSG